MFSLARRLQQTRHIGPASPGTRSVRQQAHAMCVVASARHYATTAASALAPATISSVSEIPSGFKLHTPGSVVSTTATVRQAMLHELGAEGQEVRDIIHQLRTKVCIQSMQRLTREVLASGDFPDLTHSSVIVPGSHDFLLESVLATAVAPVSAAKLLVVRNGEAGARIKEIATAQNIQVVDLVLEEDQPLNLDAVREKLSSVPGITHLAMAHCETSSGMLLPWQQIVELVNGLPKEQRPTLIADAYHTFGGTDVSWAHNVDFAIVSGNESLQGVPGVGFILFNKESAGKCESYSKRSLSFDFLSQWKAQEQGNFNGAVPTHVLAANLKALTELEEEGGWKVRQERYDDNKGLLVLGMISMGFKTFLKKDLRSNVTTTFYHPTQPNWNWEKFNNFLLNGRFVISPGNIANKDTFRIGSIGHLVRYDIVLLLDAVKAAKNKMKF